MTSKDTGVGGGLNLAIKRAKQNNVGPITRIPRTQEGGTLKKREKRPTVHEARKAKAASAASEKQKPDYHSSTSLPSSSKAILLSSLTPGKKEIGKLKEFTRQTTPETVLGAFQNQDMKSEEWEKLADQVLTRGVQRGSKKS